MQIGGEGADAALCDFRVLVLVLADAIEVFDVTGAAQQLHKVLVVRDDQQLEVALTGTTLNDPVPIGDEETRCELLSLRVLCVRVCVCVFVCVHSLNKGVCQRFNVFSVQVGGGLIQCQDPAIQTEGLRQGKTDNKRCQHLRVHTHRFKLLTHNMHKTSEKKRKKVKQVPSGQHCSVPSS